MTEVKIVSDKRNIGKSNFREYCGFIVGNCRKIKIIIIGYSQVKAWSIHCDGKLVVSPMSSPTVPDKRHTLPLAVSGKEINFTHFLVTALAVALGYVTLQRYRSIEESGSFGYVIYILPAVGSVFFICADNR